ncbi:DUF3300 domain-containing protein [Steroidobacter cummioxidans]|uniref:DUF3300 domain-containing protein n=1 Tax=Steroidobacter cummioxidans TaxID=1803913 RepID=UPI00137994BE|nr:DUF3300 domain-containing protein [Steroidobacter cummioxidans]
MNRSLLLCLLTLATVLAVGQPATNSQEVPAASPPATPQDATVPKAEPFKPEELEQIVAPIALYPDALLAQVLMASTYPLEIVLAARWAKDHPDVKGDAVAKAVENETWDASVKSMVAFPDVLTMMSDKLDWTQKLGDAVLAQRKDVMDAVQRLRAKAKDSGNLTSTKEQTIKTEAAPAGAATPQIIVIESPSPEVVYVPTYNPTVVYGAWPYPAYPPYSYYPPGYVAGTALFSFSMGMVVGGALWGGFNWGHSDIDVNVNRYNNFTRNNVNVNNRANVSNRWEHNSVHRQGVGYRDTATQQRYGRGSSEQALQARENYRGRSGNENRDLGGGNESRDLGGRGNEYRDLGGGGENRGLSNSSRDVSERAPGAGSSGRSADAFKGIDNGARTRAQSSRGMSSRGGMSRGGGRRR